MPDQADRPLRWEVQPWVIGVSFTLCVLLAGFSFFAADPVAPPSPTTVYVPSTQPIDSLSSEDVDNLRAFVEQALRDDRLARRTRRQLAAILDLLDGVEDGTVSVAPGIDERTDPAPTPPPATPPRPTATTTTSTSTTTTQPPRIDLNGLIDDVLGS